MIQSDQVDWSVDAKHGPLRQLKLFLQQRLQIRRAGGQYLEPHCIAEVALGQFHPHRLPQIVNLAFVDREVGVARDPELRETADLPARKDVLQMRTDHRREHDERLPPRHQAFRQRDHPRQHPWNLENRDGRRPAEGILALEMQDEVQRLVQYLRERVRRVEADRREQRPHLAHEILAHPGALIVVALRVVQHNDIPALQRRHDRLIEQPVLRGDEPVRAIHDGDIRRRLWRGPAGLADLLGQIGHADFEEFVHVGRDDADVAQALRQRHRSAGSHREHAFVEREHRQLPVQVELGTGLHGGEQRTRLVSVFAHHSGQR